MLKRESENFDNFSELLQEALEKVIGKIEDVGYNVSLQNLSTWIDYYSDRILSDNPYSTTKLEDIQTFIDFIRQNGS